MGYMKNLFIAREDWWQGLIEQLREPAVYVRTPEPEWFMVRLPDGIHVSRIDDLEFVELDPSQLNRPEPIECDAKNPTERLEAIQRLRGQSKTSESEK